MKKTLILFVSLLSSLYSLPESSVYHKIIKMYENNASPKLLLEIGKLASQMEISLEAYQKDNNYRTIAHLKIVKSDNYGDFVAYDGYHFKQIIKKYPHSNLVDDAKYYLIYLSDDVNNYTDLNEEKTKLEAFIKKYPKSNLLTQAKERIEFIENSIKSGAPAILD